jgi:hypothetical protein
MDGVADMDRDGVREEVVGGDRAASAPDVQRQCRWYTERRF